MYFLRQLVIYVHCFYFNRKLYISTGIIRGFEDYIRIQEGQLRIHLVLNLQLRF